MLTVLSQVPRPFNRLFSRATLQLIRLAAVSSTVLVLAVGDVGELPIEVFRRYLNFTITEISCSHVVVEVTDLGPSRLCQLVVRNWHRYSSELFIQL